MGNSKLFRRESCTQAYCMLCNVHACGGGGGERGKSRPEWECRPNDKSGAGDANARAQRSRMQQPSKEVEFFHSVAAILHKSTNESALVCNFLFKYWPERNISQSSSFAPEPRHKNTLTLASKNGNDSLFLLGAAALSPDRHDLLGLCLQ